MTEHLEFEDEAKEHLKTEVVDQEESSSHSDDSKLSENEITVLKVSYEDTEDTQESQLLLMKSLGATPKNILSETKRNPSQKRHQDEVLPTESVPQDSEESYLTQPTKSVFTVIKKRRLLLHDEQKRRSAFVGLRRETPSSQLSQFSEHQFSDAESDEEFPTFSDSQIDRFCSSPAKTIANSAPDRGLKANSTSSPEVVPGTVFKSPKVGDKRKALMLVKSNKRLRFDNSDTVTNEESIRETLNETDDTDRDMEPAASDDGLCLLLESTQRTSEESDELQYDPNSPVLTPEDQNDLDITTQDLFD